MDEFLNSARGTNLAMHFQRRCAVNDYYRLVPERRTPMVAMNNLQDLLIEQLQDLYNAEGQLVKALPKMAKAATNPDLKQAFQKHLAQTEEHVSRLERVFEALGEKAKGKTCHGMKGLIEEGNEAIKEEAEDAVRDAALIAAAQRVEHYEIAGYGCVRTYAESLGQTEAAQLLQQTLEEEGETDKLLTQIAECCVNEAAESFEAEESEEEEESPSRRSR
jgi:ferritin-like metal-binding protein YciE